MRNDYLDYDLTAQRVTQQRKAKNMTQEKLAEAIDVDTRHIAYIEATQRNALPQTLERLAIALDTTTRFLMFGD